MRKKQYWRINEQVRAPEVRVIDAKGKQIGVLPIAEAQKARAESGTDLIEIAPNANPPVVKLIEFGKFKYDQEKKERKEKKSAKAGELKEVRFSPFIADQDYATRIERVKEFLGEGNKVRTVVVFKGRQMGSKKFGYQLLERVLDEVRDIVAVDMEPKFYGRSLGMVISPTKKKGVKTNAKTEDKEIADQKN